MCKTRPLRPTDVPLDTACAAIGSNEPLFEAKRVNESEWVVSAAHWILIHMLTCGFLQLCTPGTNTPVLFSYAAVFATSDPIETGNLVVGESKLANTIGEQRVYVS